MALVYRPINAVSFQITLADESGNTSTKQYVVDPASFDPASDLLADLWTIRDAFLSDLAAVTDAAIVSVYTTIVQVEDTNLLGSAGSEVENLASISANLSTAGKFAIIQIPAADIGIFVDTAGPNKNVVDIADLALTAFVANFQDGIGDLTLSDGEKVHATTPLKSGKRIHRRSTKG